MNNRPIFALALVFTLSTLLGGCARGRAGGSGGGGDDAWGTPEDGLWEGTGDGSFSTSGLGDLELVVDASLTLDEEFATGWISIEGTGEDASGDCTFDLESVTLEDEPTSVSFSCGFEDGELGGGGGDGENDSASVTLRRTDETTLTGNLEAQGSDDIGGEWVLLISLELRD